MPKIYSDASYIFPALKKGEVFSSEEFLSRFESENIRQLLSEYEKHGGNFGHLLAVLKPLASPPRKRYPSRSVWTAVRRYEKWLHRDIQKLPLPEPVWEAMDELLAQVRRCSDVWKLLEQGESVLRQLGPKRGKGRPRGPTFQSLVAAIVAIEFRRRFGSPHYRYIRILLQAAAPENFPPSTTEDHIHQRVKTIPPGNACLQHAALFP